MHGMIINVSHHNLQITTAAFFQSRTTAMITVPFDKTPETLGVRNHILGMNTNGRWKCAFFKMCCFRNEKIYRLLQIFEKLSRYLGVISRRTCGWHVLWLFFDWLWRVKGNNAQVGIIKLIFKHNGFILLAWLFLFALRQ